MDPDQMASSEVCSILVLIMYFNFRVENSVDPDQMASSEAS